MSFSQFELECLEEHNRLRARHGCPPLELDRNLCSYAGQWAQNLVRRGTLQHRTDMRYGENLYWASGVQVNGATAVKSWYAEIQHYRQPVFSSSTGHYTQVVWRNSHKLGVAVATRGGETYVVANYDPPGNFQGQFAQNVPSAGA